MVLMLVRPVLPLLHIPRVVVTRSRRVRYVLLAHPDPLVPPVRLTEVLRDLPPIALVVGPLLKVPMVPPSEVDVLRMVVRAILLILLIPSIFLVVLTVPPKVLISPLAHPLEVVLVPVVLTVVRNADPLMLAVSVMSVPRLLLSPAIRLVIRLVAVPVLLHIVRVVLTTRRNLVYEVVAQWSVLRLPVALRVDLSVAPLIGAGLGLALLTLRMFYLVMVVLKASSLAHGASMSCSDPAAIGPKAIVS